MKSALIKLREVEHSLSNTEANIARYIQENPESATTLTVRELADATYSSPSSVVRVCQSIGFKGYKEFREVLILELAMLGQELSHEETDVTVDDPMDKIIEKVTFNNIRSLEDTMHLLNIETLNACVNLLISSHTIHLFGIGASFCIAKDTYLKFLRLNKPCIVNEDPHSQILQAKNSSPEDVAIIFSYGGQTAEMVNCINIMKQNHTPCIAITRFSPSPVAKLADYILYVAANETLFRSAAMSSRVSQLNIVDILYTGFTTRQHEYTMKQLVHTHIQKDDPFSSVYTNLNSTCRVG